MSARSMRACRGRPDVAPASTCRSAGGCEKAMPRRSARRRCGPSRARRHRRPHSPVLPKPWISTTRAVPPTRTLIVGRRHHLELRKSAGKAGRGVRRQGASARLAARPAATRRKRRENVDETVADIIGSLGWGDGIRIRGRSPDAVTPVFKGVAHQRPPSPRHSIGRLRPT